MAAKLNTQISSSIQSFVAELTSLVRTAALESVQSALGGGGGNGSVSGARRGPGRPRGSGMHRGPGRPKGSGATKSAMTAKPAKPGRRVRRSSEDVEALAAKFLAYVKSNDGKRLEEIARSMNVGTADLKRPVMNLVEAKAVKTTGAKRGTMYHVAGGGGGGRGAAKGKRAAKKAGRPAKAKKAARLGRTKKANASSATTKSASVARAKAAAGTKAQPAAVMT